MTAASAPAPFLEPQWFTLLFLAGWLGVTGLMAHVSGWASLGDRYAATAKVDGIRFRFASGSLGWKFFPVSYGNCLFVTINVEGLYLSILFPFRFLCPSLFIPWSSFESVERRRFLLFPYDVLTIRDHWTELGLYAWAGRSVREAYESAKLGSAL